MAVLAVGAAGAAIGAGIGVAAGASTFAAIASAAAIGWSVGTLLGGMLFPKKVHNEGARLNDLSVTSSTFGAVIPIAYGRERISGNVIWATPLREQVNNEGGSGKKGGGKGAQTSTTTYTYFSSFALALCEGVVDKVLRIWADNKLVYNAIGGTDSVKRPGFNFRFYPGNETQVADSIIEADKGVGNVPGYRGLCYLVFDDIPVEDYGNRMPNIQAEVVFATVPDYDYVLLTRASPSIFGDIQPEAIGVNWLTGVAYLQGIDPNGIVVVDIATMTTIREVPMTSILADGSDGGLDPGWLGLGGNNLHVGIDGALYFRVGPTWHGGRYVRIDPNSMTETASFPSTLLFGSTETSLNGFSYSNTTISYFDPLTGRNDFFACVGFFGDVGVLYIPSMTYAGGAGTTIADNQVGRVITQGKIDIGTGDAWILGQRGLIPPAAYVSLTRVRVGEFGLDSTGPAGVTLTQMATFVSTDFDPLGIGFDTTAGSLSYDMTDDTLIFQVGTIHAPFNTGNTYLVKWSPVSGIVWVTQADTVNSEGAGWNSLPSNVAFGTFAKFNVGDLYMADTATGLITLEQRHAGSLSGWPISNGLAWAQVYDSTYQYILAFVNESPGVGRSFAKVRLGRAAGASTILGDIVADLCTRAGFIDTDFDVTELTDVVQGFVISQRATVVDVLGPVFATYLVDGVETDYILKFHHRGRAITTTVAEDDLIRIKDDTAEPYNEVRAQEVELPMRVTLTYADFDRDYQNNTQSAKRMRNPDPTVFSDTQADIDLAIVSTATPIKQMVEKILFTAWNERHTFQVRLPPQYAYLDPADVVTFNLNDGYTARARLGPTGLGVDYTLDAKLIGETDGQYISNAIPVQGVPWEPSHTLTNFSPTRLILLDVPLLRDIDDTGGRAIRGYWVATPYSTTGSWPGAVLQQAAEIGTWTTLDATGFEGTGGYLVAPPADTTALFATQYDGTMTVAVTGGDFVPSTITDLALANGGNPIALIKTNGEVEILQYRDAATLGSGQYQLSVLRRAQRGTDTMANGHAVGGVFVFLSTTTVEGVVVPISQRNFSEYYRAVTNGTVAQIASVTNFVFHGRDLMPYAPVDFLRELSGSPPDLLVTWKRRTRIGGNMVDGSDDVPLAEESEAYEAYIIASDGALAAFDPTAPATYVRAYTGLTSATLTYSADQQTADGFNEAADTLHLVVYQISTTVGRGFRGYQALPAF